jgi:hypothetical protein
MKTTVFFAVMAASITSVLPGPTQLTSTSAASVAQVPQDLSATEDRLLSKSAAADSSVQAAGKRKGKNGPTTSLRRKSILSPASGQANQSKRGAYLAPPAEPAQGTPVFESIANLLADYPDAVSIEIRVDKDSDYNAAIAFYRSALTGITPITNTYSASWAYPLVIPPAKPTTEFLVINTSKVPGYAPSTGLKKGTVGYVNWPSITTKGAMIAAYDYAIKTRAFEGAERPDEGPKGQRDLTSNTVRAVLKIKRPPGCFVKFVKNKDYDGVIVNPPVP